MLTSRLARRTALYRQKVYTNSCKAWYRHTQKYVYIKYTTMQVTHIIILVETLYRCIVKTTPVTVYQYSTGIQ